MSTNNKRDVQHFIPAEFPAALGLRNEENAVSLSVCYNEGGTNYFSGGQTPRGYSVNLCAVKRDDSSTTFVIGGSGFGRRFTVVPATRFNAKVLAAIDAAVLPKHAEIVALALAANYPAIAELLVSATLGIAKPKTATPSPAQWGEAGHVRAAQA